MDYNKVRNVKEAALEIYDAFGWFVFPVDPDSKKPSIVMRDKWIRGTETILPTREEVENFPWDKPGVRLGVRTGAVSGIAVVDCDTDEAYQYVKQRGHGITASVQSPREGGGWHFYFQHPGFYVKSTSNYGDIRGLDMRGDGGIVVIPPSHDPKSGRSYEWAMSPWEAPPDKAPDWLLDLWREESGDQGGVDVENAMVQGFRKGERDIGIRDLTRKLRGLNFSYEAAWTVVMQAANNCEEPFPLDEAREKLDRAYKKFQPNPTVKVNMPEDISSLSVTAPKRRHKKQGSIQAEIRDKWVADNPQIVFSRDKWWEYKGGWWREIHKLLVNRSIMDLIDATEGIETTANSIGSVRNMIETKAFVESEKWDADPNIIVLKSQTLEISPRKLREHRMDDYATSALGFDYEPSADCPTFKRVIDEAIPEEHELLQEFIGYALTTDCSLETALWLYGPPGSGKSTIIEGIIEMMGDRHTVLGLGDMEKTSFALHDLPGKTLVTSTEQPARFVKSIGEVLKIISGEMVNTTGKYQNSENTRSTAKILWAMNDTPRVSSEGSGLFRRVKVIKFPPLQSEPDPKLKETIKGDEQAGILRWALDGLDRLKARGHFVIPDKTRKATQEFKDENDYIKAFIEDECVIDPKAVKMAQVVFDRYRGWCEDNNYKPLGKITFNKEMEQRGFPVVKGREGMTIKGIETAARLHSAP